jgi:prephenate dehydrogenase
LTCVAVVGVGLIGGSVALAARRRAGAVVRGVDPDPAASSAVDELTDLEAALDGAEIAVVATPLGVLPQTLDAVLAAAPAGCAVTDVGSAKRVAMRADERFAGGHPLAGSELAGVEHAREDLFAGATWYVVPTPRTSGVLLDRLYRFVSALGARPVTIDAELHDRLMATISHLPHVLANVLVEQAAALGEPAMGPSFRDATRVAGANPALWPDILLANRDALVAQIDTAERRLAEVRAALEQGDRDTIARWQAIAAQRRDGLVEAALHSGPSRELRLSVANRPGVVAELTLALGGAGINISDMSLTPAPDNTRGEIALWVPARDYDRALALVKDL